MTPLASEIYKQLVRRVRTKSPSITYAELAALANKKVKTHHRSPAMYAALAEVTRACRSHWLPCLPAIVWRAGSAMPGDGYFKLAHPRARTDGGRVAAWEAEHAGVIREAEKYPANLG